MKHICLVAILALLTFVPETVAQQTTAPESASPKTAEAADDKKKAEPSEIKVAALSDEKLKELLSKRLDGSIGNSFRQFSNMFLVKSRLEFGMGLGLMSNSKKIANTQLQPVYPESYQPTLGEFLDVIGLQTSSDWKYDKTNQFVQSDVEMKDAIQDLAIFEFSPAAKKRPKPYQINLEKGWKTIDHGNWVMHVPPTFPVGFDIYEMGVYTTDEADKTKFYERIRKDVSLQWARRVKPDAEAGDLVDAKIGKYDALHFTSMIPSQLGEDLRWRQWVFMEGNRCYFIVSTILPEKDDEILPDVEKMLASFKSKSAKQTKPQEKVKTDKPKASGSASKIQPSKEK